MKLSLNGMPALKALLTAKDLSFFSELRLQTKQAENFGEVLSLSTLRRRAEKLGFKDETPHSDPLRLAMIGGYSLYPLHDLVRHFLETSEPAPATIELFAGAYDNYVSEALDGASPLYEFHPSKVIVIPAARRCRYQGALTDEREKVEAAARQMAHDYVDLCTAIHNQSGAEVVTTNFILPARRDPGPYRSRTLATDWSFRKLVNLELGLQAPPFVQICDVEFLASRFGLARATDERAWFETKQPYSADFLVPVARELARLLSSAHRSIKKVVALDLDNTLWGGVIGDDGLDGIEIGDTSPRGEAFKSFQQYLLSLTHRGVLLAVCSKNDYANAAEPFEKHPEMVLRMKDFASFQANWQPKSENLRRMAQELNLGLDSFVFVDDNPAEIEIVRQFVPEVSLVPLGPDPSTYTALLQDAGYFEPLAITAEDAKRTQQYQVESQRRQLLASTTDMGSYLSSLDMSATVREFQSVDAPRISQLINKSNQFNVTTRRRSETEVRQVIDDRSSGAFTIRLSDKFGDHGLVVVVIGFAHEGVFDIDTWLMSCRVLKRQVEEQTLNEIVRVALLRGCSRIKGTYLPTAKNGMVRDLYSRMGFQMVSESSNRLVFDMGCAHYIPRETKIQLLRRAYDAV